MSKSMVMIVDDDVSFNEALAAMVRKSGRDVYQVYSGKQASEAIRERKVHPDLVICDMKMPEMNGLDFVKENADKNLKLNICMISGKIEKTELLQALQLGAVDYMTKPVQYERLVDKLDRLIKPQNLA